MKTPSKQPQTIHEKLRGQRNRMAEQIESIGDQIKEAQAISVRHQEAVRDELHEKKELLIQQLKEKRRLIILSRRRLVGQLKKLTQRDVVQNQRRRQDVRKDFFFASKKDYWDRVPASRFKVFQEMHAAPRYWTVPKREGAWGGVDAHQLPLLHTVVDPSRVSAHFLDHFDIPEKSLLDGQNDPVQAHITAQDSVDELKGFYQEHVQPLSDFGYESKNPNFRILVVGDHSPEHDGEIIHPRRKSKRSTLKEPAIFGDAYSLARKTGHMGKGYEQERGQLTKALQAVNAIHAKLNTLRADDSPEEKSEKRQEAERSLKQKPELSGVRDGDKVEAREVLEAIDLTDSRGQVNPAANMAKLVKVREHLGGRKKSVSRITDITDKDREQLENTIAHSEASLSQYGEACKNFHDGDSFVYRNERGGRVPILRPDLALPMLKLRPFRFYASKLLEVDTVTYKAGQEGRYEDQRQEYIKGHVVCQVFKVQKAFEDCLAEISLKKGFTQQQLVQKARELYKTAKDNQVEGYEAVFEDLMGVINEIGQYLKDNPDGLNRETLRLALKEYLKSVDFQAVLEGAV